MVNYVGEHAKDYTLSYGQIASQSIGAIQRALLQLEDAGGTLFFGELAEVVGMCCHTYEEHVIPLVAVYHMVLPEYAARNRVAFWWASKLHFHIRHGNA